MYEPADKRPWLVTAAVYAPTGSVRPGAFFAAMYFEPWDLADGQAVDPDDFATVTSYFDVTSEPDMDKFAKAAYETGVHMADMFSLGALRVWPGLDNAAESFAATLPDEHDTAPRVEACEPDSATKALLQAAREALAAHVRANGF